MLKKEIMVGLSVLLWCMSFLGCGASGDQKTTRNRYADDGYMGISSANPGLLTSPGARNYSNDTHVVEMALKGIPDIRRISVLYRGGTAMVRIWVERGLADEKLEALRSEAENRLIVALPRYKVRVRAYR